MIDFATILTKNPVGVFATQDGDKTKTRVFQFLFADGNKVYFCTNSEKPVYNQLLKNPNVSFCTYPQDFECVLSVCGKAVLDDNIQLKQRALDENPQIKDLFGAPENQVFKLFYIDVKDVEVFSFAEGTKNYSL